MNQTLKRLGQIDPRFIYLLLSIAILIPLVRPFGLPLSVTPQVRNSFNLIDTVTAGEKVLMQFDYSIGGSADMQAAVDAVFRHLMKKGARIISISFSDQGVPFATGLMAEYEAQGKKYGTDFVNLGFLAGGETALAAFYADIAKAAPVDNRRQNTASYPIMNGIKSVSDIRLVVGMSNGIPGALEYVRQMVPYRSKTTLTIITASGVAPTVQPYVQAKQVTGLIGGMKGAAEYERLMQYAGKATAGMDAQSAAHLFLVGLVILGNISYLATRKRRADPSHR